MNYEGGIQRVLRTRHASPRARGTAPLAAAAAPRGLVHSTRCMPKRAREMRLFCSVVIKYWKRAGRHELPWRKTRDPYAILVSEMMLQQTQVYRVIPFYTRFLARFPTAHVLAAAPLAEVLRFWNGLGYNRRAKFLHDAARAIVAQHDGTVPRGYAPLRALPGIGDYTAKAVRVFAFNEPEVLIETNVRAVFIHHFFPRSRSVPDAKLLPLIGATVALLPRGTSARMWYAALMDYGTHLKATHSNPSRKSAHHVRQSKFAGSLREVRGEILRALLRGGDLALVGDRFPERFAEAYTALKREGLIAALHSEQ